MSGESWVQKRVWFQKTGRARYISHLDLNRCMSRAIHFAKVPIWYTEGFNPHPFLTFALPLSLGIDGIHESMDIRLTEETDHEEMIRKVNSALPGDIRLYAVTDPVMKPGKIAFAGFEVTLTPETEGQDSALLDACGRILDEECIIVDKKTKSGIKQIDIRPYVTFEDLRREDGSVSFSIVLPAGSTQNINPFLILDALQRIGGVPFYTRIIRTDLYDKDMQCFA